MWHQIIKTPSESSSINNSSSAQSNSNRSSGSNHNVMMFSLEPSTCATNSRNGTESDVLSWNTTDVANWLASIGFPQYSSRFLSHVIDGKVLLEMDRTDIQSMDISIVGHRSLILRAIRNLQEKHQNIITLIRSTD